MVSVLLQLIIIYNIFTNKQNLTCVSHWLQYISLYLFHMEVKLILIFTSLSDILPSEPT